MSDTLAYKGYQGTVEYSSEDRCLHGVVAGIRDTVSYGGDDLKRLEKNFRAAVDEYLAFCEAEGKQPDQPFKGVFQVRLKGDLHRRLAIYAAQRKESINAATNEAIERLLSENAG